MTACLEQADVAMEFVDIAQIILLKTGVTLACFGEFGEKPIF